MLIQLVDAILAVHIATIVRQHLVVVAKVNQRIQQVAVAPRFRRTENAGTDLRQRLVKLFILLVIFARFIAAATQLLHLFRGVAEDKDILFAHVLLHLHVRPVEGADRQRAVKGKLHITGAGGFRACERDLFRQVCRRNDQLRQADAVIGDKNDLQLVANLRIVIDHRRHIVDQVNNMLGHVVG